MRANAAMGAQAYLTAFVAHFRSEEFHRYVIRVIPLRPRSAL